MNLIQCNFHLSCCLKNQSKHSCSTWRVEKCSASWEKKLKYWCRVAVICVVPTAARSTCILIHVFQLMPALCTHTHTCSRAAVVLTAHSSGYAAHFKPSWPLLLLAALQANGPTQQPLVCSASTLPEDPLLCLRWFFAHETNIFQFEVFIFEVHACTVGPHS